MSDYYILKGKRVYLVKNVLDWAKQFEKPNRIVKQTKLKNGEFVSTVFLGLDYNFSGKKRRIFETMVFPSRNNFSELDCDRYATWGEAEKGHERMIKKWKQMK